MIQLIIYISKDKKVKRVLTYHQKQATDLSELARDICSDCGDNYYGHKVIRL